MKIEINTDGKLICYGSATEYLSISWNNRKNWKTLRNSLYMSGAAVDDSIDLKCLLESQLSKCGDARLNCSGMLNSKWACRSGSTIELVLKYLNRSK